MNYEIDYGDLMLFMYLSIITVIFFLLIRRKFIGTYKKGKIVLILFGILFLLICSIALCFIGNRWDFHYVTEFLLFKKINDIGIDYVGLSYGRAIGYTFLFLGISALIIENPYIQRMIPKNILVLKANKVEGQEDKKIYMSPELLFFYLIIVPLLLIFPLSLLYFLVKSWIIDEFKFALALSIITFLFAGFLLFIFILLRKYSTFKIEMDDKGIIFYGFLRKSSAHWQEVISITNDSPFLGKNVAVVKTVNGKFFFPLSIKEYRKWKLEEDTDKSISPENCSLYIEIQNKLSKESIKSIKETSI